MQQRKAWRLYREIGGTIAGKQPNAGHLALAELEVEGLLAGVVTQNIDGLHQAAGSRNVLEIHGGGENLRCLQCDSIESIRPQHLEPGPPPTCRQCGRPLKPDYVLFEEPVRCMDAISGLLEGADVLLSIGTSAQVTPACLFPDWVRAAGGHVIEGRDDSDAPLADVPPSEVFAGASFQSGPWGLEARLAHRDRKTDPASGEKEIGSANLLDATLHYRIGESWSLALTATNLLDELYFRSADEKAPLAAGRSIGLRASWRR